jgi:holo-[acyl-carrier protein] synthase
MIAGVGTDIVEIDRIAEAMRRDGFAARIFTDAERNYCLSKVDSAQHFAGRFAAKEAVAKALGGSLSWQDVEILPDSFGKPVVRLLNGASDAAGRMQVMVSISHCRAYAVAYAVVITAG